MLFAHQANLFRVVVASTAERILVVELEPSPLGTTSALPVHETALAAIAPADEAPDGSRHVARLGRGIGLFQGLSRGLRLPISLRFEPFELLGDRGLNDGREVLSH